MGSGVRRIADCLSVAGSSAVMHHDATNSEGRRRA